MAEEREEQAVRLVTGFEKYDTDILLAIREGQENGLAEVLRHEEAGTLHVRPKPGAATAKEAGETIMMLYDAITLELRQRGALK
jgi:hypothetical protein